MAEMRKHRRHIVCLYYRMSVQIIELSDSSYNGKSTILCAIVIIFYLYITLKISSQLYRKLNPNAKYLNPNIINALSQDTMKTIQYLMGIIVKDNIDEKVKEYEYEITNLSNAIKESTKTAEKAAILVSALNKKIYDSFQTKLASFNAFFDNTKKTIGEVQTSIDSLNKKYEKLQEQYKTRLQTYVNNLIEFMTRIADQISKATVIPSLFNMITPLKKIYDAIFLTLKNNLNFIREIYGDSNYNINGVQYDSTAKTNVNTGFSSSKSILSISGYK